VVLPLPTIYAHVENYVCLSRGVHVKGVTWWIVMKIVAGVGDLM
jgi:hypothetical protein